MTVAIVTHNDADDLPACLEALAAQTEREFEIVVVDCQSADASREVAARNAPAGRGFELIALAENAGFAGGMNAAFAATTAPYLLTLNADCTLAPDALARLLARARAAEAAGLCLGAVTPRLARPGEPPRLDACGMVLSPAWRHFDRGADERDDGRYGAPAQVFGGTGAATLWSRAAADDVALAPGELFDPRFHTFREDAELCFRFAARGWLVVYAPEATGVHRRRVLPSRRRAIAELANRNSLRNRYLLRIYHQTLPNLLWTLPFALARDLAALVYVLSFERSSLPAYGWLLRHRRELWRRRGAIQRRRTEPWHRLDRWFLGGVRPLAGAAGARLAERPS